MDIVSKLTLEVEILAVRPRGLVAIGQAKFFCPLLHVGATVFGSYLCFHSTQPKSGLVKSAAMYCEPSTTTARASAKMAAVALS